MGEALGQPFVKKTLGAEGKATRRRNGAGRSRRRCTTTIETLAWMDDATKKRALLRSSRGSRNKIALPGQVARLLEARDRSRRRCLGNIERASAFEITRASSRRSASPSTATSGR